VASSKEGLPSPSDGTVFDAEELFALAKLDLKKGNVAEALEKLKSITRGEQAPPGAYSICGHVYLQLELPDRAERMFLKHLALYPGAPDEMFALGSVHFHTGRNAEALKLWDDLLQKFPSYTPALLYRAILQAQAGQVAAARNDLETLMKSTPVESPYFKPAQELLQRLDAQRPVNASATVPYAGPALARTAYSSETE
jgi:tetratricopeptide (TPR) repeat protein